MLAQGTTTEPNQNETTTDQPTTVPSTPTTVPPTVPPTQEPRQGPTNFSYAVNNTVCIRLVATMKLNITYFNGTEVSV